VSLPATGSNLQPATESMTLLVAGVIVHDRTTDRVALLQRGPQAKFGRGLWDLPVGKATPGEPITATAVRELAEETGLVVDPADLQLVHVIHSSFGVESPTGFVTIVFAAHRWSGELANLEPAKHASAEWIDATAIPEAFVNTTGAALHSYLAGEVEVSIDGWS
jgi:ADP-ribose pyrophosphatase YjhB (NUDIX family)